MANGQDKAKKHPPKDMNNKDNDEIEKLSSIKERIECKRRQAETEKYQAETREHRKSFWKKPAFLGTAIPIIFAILIFVATGLTSGWFDVKQKRLENEKILLENKKALLETKTVKLERKFDDKKAELEEKYEEKFLALKKELRNKEKAQDKYAKLRLYLKGQRLDVKMLLPKEILGKTSEETTNKLQQYMKTLVQVKSEDKYSLDDWKYKGVFKFNTGKYEEAIDSFRKALDKAPDNANASYFHNFIGAAYERQDMYTKALEEFDKSIELNPNNPHPYTNKAVTYLHLKKEEEAETQINLAKKIIKKEEFEESAKPFYNKKIEFLEKDLRKLKGAKKK